MSAPKKTHFKCPEVRVPDEVIEKARGNARMKRKNDEMQNSARDNIRRSSSDAVFNKKFKRDRGLGDIKSRSQADELTQLMGSVKEYSSQTFKGMEKLNHKADVLTKLGAEPLKQQTMPFRMKMGIEAGRKKRTEKMQERAAVEGTILAKSLQVKKKSTTNRGGKNQKSKKQY